MKVLVIPDIHSRKFWRQAIANNIDKVGKVIFLGDYLDPYPEEIQMTPELMEINDFYDLEDALNMLNDIVSLKKNESDKYILLCGNHTCSYIWPDFEAATRTDRENWKEYHNFFLENLNLFNLVWTEDNAIFSHAGISEGWANQVWNYMSRKGELSSVIEIAVMLQEIPLNEFDGVSLISDISFYRGGYSQYGSCEWADLREHIDIKNSSNNNIIPNGEDGIYQVFGHTQLREPLITDKWACLDCRKGFIFDTITHEITEC